MSKEKTLEEWIEFYNRKCPEPFERDERYELFYSPKYGFCEITATEKMLLVNQLCGNIKAWRKTLEEVARISNLPVIGTHFIRKIRPYIKLVGFEIRGSEETEEGLRFYCEDFETGQKGWASPAWIMPNGKRAYCITWEVK